MGPRPNWAQWVPGPTGPNGSRAQWAQQVPAPISRNISVVVFSGRITQHNKMDIAIYFFCVRCLLALLTMLDNKLKQKSKSTEFHCGAGTRCCIPPRRYETIVQSIPAMRCAAMLSRRRVAAMRCDALECSVLTLRCDAMLMARYVAAMRCSTNCGDAID